MKLNVHFSREEFACSCGCGFDTVDAELLKVLTQLRDWYGQPITITSGARCKSHNAIVGGKPGSRHLVGKAADFKAENVAPSIVQEKIREFWPDRFGLGKGASFTHLDVREHRADWGY